MIGQTVSHYRITAELGRGGMGEVYRAEDLKLGRTVALKFLPPELVRDPEAKARFVHEARAASSLDHPNIGTIYEIDETDDGRMFIAMACYEGQTLKEKIAQGPLPIDDVLTIASQCAEGLARAHAGGIVHRDLKPANLFLTRDGQAKLLDFGLAKLAGQTRLTTTGTRMGTVAYMSPEQARGETVDERTDVWSLGVLMYEMLAGRLPFGGESEPAVLYAIIHEEPADLVTQRPDAPDELVKIVERAFAKDPPGRYSSIAALLADLEAVRQQRARERHAAAEPARHRHRWTWAIAGVLGGAALLLAIFFGTGRIGGPAGTAQHGDTTRIQSLAVLPFDNLMKDPDQDYFVDGMHEALITRVSKISKLRVISRTSVLRYRDGQKSVPEIARELDVDAVIEGSVLRVGDEVRITAQLIDGDTDEHLWAESYDRDLVHVLALLDEVATAISLEVRATLAPPRDGSAVTERPVDPDAYEAFLRGRRQMEKFSRSMATQAAVHFERAIAIDPTFARAYSGLAGAHFIMMIMGREKPEQTAPRVRDLAARALELDPDEDTALAMMGYVELYFDWDFAGAADLFHHALQINPNNYIAYHGLADCEAIRGNHDESLRLVRRGWQCDPFSPLAMTPVIGHLMMAHRYEELIGEARRMLETNPEFLIVHTWIARALWQLDRYEESIAERRLRSTAWSDSLAAVLEKGLRESGPEGAMWAQARYYEDIAQTQDIDPSDMAKIYAQAGEMDRAFVWLEKAFQERDPFLVHLLMDPRLDALREDRRFGAIRARLGLEN